MQMQVGCKKGKKWDARKERSDADASGMQELAK
jgi:hypothetical protein